MTSGVVHHHQPCLLVWFLTIDHACWRGTSLYAMPSGQLPLQSTFLLVECRWMKGGYKSGATCTEVQLYQTCLIVRCHSQICLLVQCNYYQTCMLVSWIHLRMFVKCCSIKQGIWSVTNPSDMPTGRMPLHRVVKLAGYHPGRHLEYITFWIMY